MIDPALLIAARFSQVKIAEPFGACGITTV
jgi:hypothetical protein